MKKHILMIIAIGIMTAAVFASVQTAYAAGKPEGCIAFTSSEPFTVSLGKTSSVRTWDGTVQVSPGNAGWEEYMVGTEVSAISVDGTYIVSFRGQGNHHISDNESLNNYASFALSGTGNISCTGNIENLLDHTAVQDGRHPEMEKYALSFLFYGCDRLTKAPELPARTLTEDCYRFMFGYCTGLTEAPALPAETLTKNCYYSMFQNCTSLTKAPVISALTLADSCCFCMFGYCTSLITAPALPAKTIAPKCYEYMFKGCTSLTKAPKLPGQTLAEDCYNRMFIDCTSLETAPALPAKALDKSCYTQMFKGCTSLTKAPALPAETLAESCYSYMFSGCTSLKEASEMSAVTLADYSCLEMFTGCTSLQEAPGLPAETLAVSCYLRMFKGCTSLTRPPALPATTLARNCYQEMFGSTGVRISSTKGTADDGINYCIPYMIPKNGEGTIDYRSLENMFEDTKGPFTGTPEINTTYYLPDVTGTPMAAMKAKGKTALIISWAKVNGADGYDIFFARCSRKDSKKPVKRVKTIKGNKVFQWTKTKLKKGTAYKAYVRAYVMIDGKKVYKKSGPLMHAFARGYNKKYTNARSVSVNKTKVTLVQGKTFQIKGKVVKLKKSRKLMPKSHAAKLRYLSTNKKIATVNKSGRITAKGTGTCYVYAYAHNGVYKKVKVIVE